MEDTNNESSKLKSVINGVPRWSHLIISLGTMVFGVGVMYNELQGLKARVESMDNVSFQQVKMAGEIENLHEQIGASNETQKQTNDSVNKLTDAVSDLNVSVAKLEGRLSISNENRKRK